MTKQPFPSDNQDKFLLRLPEGMRERIKAAADKNSRSMNSEIVAALEDKFPVIDPDLVPLVDFVSRVLPDESMEMHLFFARRLLPELYQALARVADVPASLNESLAYQSDTEKKRA